MISEFLSTTALSLDDGSSISWGWMLGIVASWSLIPGVFLLKAFLDLRRRQVWEDTQKDIDEALHGTGHDFRRSQHGFISLWMIIVVLVVAVAGGFFHALKLEKEDSKAWKKFVRDHDCQVLQRNEPDTYTRWRTMWKCEDGIIYWRRD